MSRVRDEMVGLILQFLGEDEKYKETMHKLEQESGVFFNLNYFEEKILNGEWELAEKYISGFTAYNDNRHSFKIMFEIAKQKYLEALDRHDTAEALNILLNDLEKFSSYNEDLYKEITQLFTLGNIRENPHLSQYGDTRSTRTGMMVLLKFLIITNPLFKGKLMFPSMGSNRLLDLINQSLNWQHLNCQNPAPNPEIKSLLIDHVCPSPVTGSHALVPVTLPYPPAQFPAPFPSMEGASVPYQAPAEVPSQTRPWLALGTSGLFDPAGAGFTAIDRMAKELRYFQSNSEAIGSSSREVINEANRKSDIVPHAKATSSSQIGAHTKMRNSTKEKLVEEVIYINKPWQLIDIQDPVKCRLDVLLGTVSSCRVVRLLYTRLGSGILALGSNGVQRLWKKLRRRGRGSKASASFVLQLLEGTDSCALMANDVSGVNLEEAVPCIALTHNGNYIMSAYGGKVKLFDISSEIKEVRTFENDELPPGATNIAFNPRNNNIIAIGTQDCNIMIYNNRHNEIQTAIKFHKNRITGLAFSFTLGILVSADCDGQICSWTADKWEKKQYFTLCSAFEKASAGGATHLQFHCDQVRLLVFQETQLVLYDATMMELIEKWHPNGILPAPICHASFNTKLVYTAFCDGNIGVFDVDTLRLRCRIAPSAYLPRTVLNRTNVLYNIVIAACPQRDNQFAVGLPNGTVLVVEPTDGAWGSSPPPGDVSSSRVVSCYSCKLMQG